MEKNEILMIYGKNYKEMTKEILTSAKLAEQIGDKKKKIGLKPNLVVAKTPESGATTHMEMIEGTIEYLQENGLKIFPLRKVPGLVIVLRLHSVSVVIRKWRANTA